MENDTHSRLRTLGGVNAYHSGSGHGDMPNCEHCAEAIDGVSAYSCSHCGSTFCPEHRLPEAHDCPFIATISAPSMRTDSDPSSETQTGSIESATQADANSTSRHQETNPDMENTSPPQRSNHGKRHREWEPESSSPDLQVDGSIKGEQTAPFTGQTRDGFFASGRRWVGLRLDTPVRTVYRVGFVLLLLGLGYGLYGLL